jgi:hypothetical protein
MLGGDDSSPVGEGPMKGAKSQPDSDEFAKAVGRALRRAGKRARVIARAYGTRSTSEERKGGGGEALALR